MTKCETILLRGKRKALFEAYKSARKILFEQQENQEQIHTRAIIMAINTPQPRFWISPYRVYRIIERLLNGKEPLKTWTTREKMYKDIMDAYERLKDKKMFAGMPLIFIASFVAMEPASGFYISASRAGRMIASEMKERRQH